MRNWEWYYLNGLCHRDLLTLRGHTEGVYAVAWSKDGQLASAGMDGIVRLWDVTRGQEIRNLRGHALAVHSLSWSPDNKKLASAS